MNRAVSLADYANLALNSTDVGKAQASASSFTSVNVYVAPAAENSTQDPFPGYDPATYIDAYDADDISTALDEYAWSTVKLAAEDALSGKTQIGVSTTILPPSYTPVVLNIKYTKLDNYSDTDIVANMKSILERKYGYNSSDFKSVLYPEDIETWIRLTPGVKSATVSSVYRKGQPTGRAALVGVDGEIFRILPSLTTISAAATDSTPSSITLSGVTISPSFAAGTYSYTGTTSASTSTIHITGVARATLGYNSGSQDVASDGTLIAEITLASGTKDLVITTVAEDGVTTSTYTFTITKS